MESWDWVAFARKRKKTIIWMTVLTVVVTAVVTYIMPPTYRSTAIIHIKPMADGEALSYPTAIQLEARNAGEIIKSASVARLAAKRLGVAKLTGTIDYRVPEDTGLVEVIVDDSTPRLAADEANAIAQAYIDYNSQVVASNAAATQKSVEAQLDQLREEIDKKQKQLDEARLQPGNTAEVSGLQDEIDTLKTGYEGVLARWQSVPTAQTQLSTNVQFADKAMPDPEVVSPRPVLNLALGLLGGLLLGFAVARMTERDTVRDGLGS